MNFSISAVADNWTAVNKHKSGRHSLQGITATALESNKFQDIRN